jgi:hypothetical protein
LWVSHIGSFGAANWHKFKVTDPTTDDLGAGAGANFDGHKQATRNFKETAGVVEGRPGVIESSNIDPLNENSNKGWLDAFMIC